MTRHAVHAAALFDGTTLHRNVSHEREAAPTSAPRSPPPGVYGGAAVVGARTTTVVDGADTDDRGA